MPSQWLRPGACSEQHIRFTDRLALVPRLLVLPDLNVSSVEGSFFRVKDSIQHKSTYRADDHRVVDRSPPGTMTDHLASIYSEEIAPARKGLRGGVPEASQFLRRISAIRSAMLSVNCGRCKLRQGHVCNKSPVDDDDAVKSKGECWRRLQELFELGLKWGERLYRLSSSAYSRALPVEIVFRTLVRNVRDGERHPHTAAAVTCFRDGTGSNWFRAVTEFRIPIREFTEQTYFGLPYKIFHEIIVHSVQGTVPADKSLPPCRIPYGSDSGFSEGIMDEIAYETLLTALHHVRTVSRKGTIRPFIDVVERVSRLMNEKRRLSYLMDGPSSGNSHSRSFGYDAYDTTVELMGRDQAWQLLLDLNLLDTDRAGRSTIFRSLALVKEAPREIAHPRGSAAYAIVALIIDSLRLMATEQDAESCLPELRELTGAAIPESTAR